MKDNPELYLVKKAKELSKIIFDVTETSPKKFRFTIISRLQNYSVDLVSFLYDANDTITNLKIFSDYDKKVNNEKIKTKGRI